MTKNKRAKYILTDSCYWWAYAKKTRSRHWIEIVNIKTGNVKKLRSGSIISIIKGRK